MCRPIASVPPVVARLDRFVSDCSLERIVFTTIATFAVSGPIAAIVYGVVREFTRDAAYRAAGLDPEAEHRKMMALEEENRYVGGVRVHPLSRPNCASGPITGRGLYY
jgi:hypothetical protein